MRMRKILTILCIALVSISISGCSIINSVKDVKEIPNTALAVADNANAQSAYSASVTAAAQLIAINTILTAENVKSKAIEILGSTLPGDFEVILRADSTGVASIKYFPPESRTEIIIPKS